MTAEEYWQRLFEFFGFSGFSSSCRTHGPDTDPTGTRGSTRRPCGRYVVGRRRPQGLVQSLVLSLVTIVDDQVDDMASGNQNVGIDNQKSGAFLTQVMSSSKVMDPQTAVYTIREVCQKDIGIYQTRGMGCLVYTNGSERLLTWRGVAGKGDSNKRIIMDRFTSTKSEIGEYRFESSTVNEIGNTGFSLLSVRPVDEPGNARNPNKKKNCCEYLELQVPKQTECKFQAYSFVRNKVLKLDLTYNTTNKKHELSINSDTSKKLEKEILEKTSILGAPIIVDCRKQSEISSPYCVVGVVGSSDDDGQLIPYFITGEVLLDQESSSRKASSGEDDSTDSSVQLPTEQKRPTTDNEKVVTGIRGKQPASTSTSAVKGLICQESSKEGKQPASTSASTDRGLTSEESSEEVKDGEFPLQWLPYLALDIQAERKKWKSVGRDLGLEEGVLNGIESDNDEEYERCYEVLKTWYQKNATHSFEVVASVLKKQGMNKIREDYCLSGHDPHTQRVMNIANLKMGVVAGDDLRGITQAVKNKCKRFGRALGLSDGDLDQIVQENKGNISEQSYQIVQKWKQARKSSDATYDALAQALLDRTVDMEAVMSKFCLVGK